jgi:hypothetical protein
MQTIKAMEKASNQTQFVHDGWAAAERRSVYVLEFLLLAI